MISINTPNIVTLSDAIKALDVSGNPFVFIDSCSFLDILRIPVPDRKNTLEMLRALLGIKSFVISGQLLSFSSSICIKEFNDHATNIVDSLPFHIQTIQKPLHALIDFINESGLSGSKIAKIDFATYQLERFFTDLVDVMTRNTFFVDVSPELKDLAHVRTINKLPPALFKGEYKDCIVWETFLALRRNQNNKSTPAFFLSSNKSDYCASPATRDFHPKILMEVKGLNSYYSSDYLALKHRLIEFDTYETF